MEELFKTTDNYIFTTSTAEVMSPDDFIVEFISDLPDMNNKENSVIKINNFDELMDFLEKMGY